MSDGDEGEDIVTRTLLSEEGRPLLVVREPRAEYERRAALLRRLALLARAYTDGYERKMPPLPLRRRADVEAYRVFTERAYASVARVVLRLDAIAPGGCLEQWHDAVRDVKGLAYEEVERELMVVRVAP